MNCPLCNQICNQSILDRGVISSPRYRFSCKKCNLFFSSYIIFYNQFSIEVHRNTIYFKDQPIGNFNIETVDDSTIKQFVEKVKSIETFI